MDDFEIDDEDDLDTDFANDMPEDLEGIRDKD
jgi:hypothetical protein